MKPLQLLHYKIIYLLLNAFKLGKTRTRHNQLPSVIWNFIMAQRSCFKQIITS